MLFVVGELTTALCEFVSAGNLPERTALRGRQMGAKIMDVKEIERAIVRLPARDLDKLAGWLEDYRARMWDKQIEEDLEAGRLNALLAEVDEEYEAGLSQPL